MRKGFRGKRNTGMSTGMAAGKSSFADIQGTHRRICAEMLERLEPDFDTFE